MHREQAHEFLLDLLGNCVPKGQVDRVGQFYTEDVVGHFQGEKFSFADLKERVRLLGENIEDAHVEIVDFMQFEQFIFVVSRQSWRQKSDHKLLDVLMSVVYRMRALLNYGLYGIRKRIILRQLIKRFRKPLSI
jgi:hypothetical protein